MSPIRLEMLSGSVLVFDDPAPLIRLFVGPDGVDGYDGWARKTPPNRLVAEDVTVLNTYARARSGHVRWQELISDRGPAWLAAIDPGWDAAMTDESEWERAEIRSKVEAAFTAMCGPYRGLSVASKMLHLKRPRLIPLLDALVVEHLGPSVPSAAPPGVKAEYAARVIAHLATQARSNRAALAGLQRELGKEGIELSAIRLIDILLWSSHPAASLGAPIERHIRVSAGPQP
ncbi:MAG: DUF6308 family protein [Gaiellales bacterium]